MPLCTPYGVDYAFLGPSRTYFDARLETISGLASKT